MGCEFAKGQVLLWGSSWNSGPHIRTHPKSEYPPPPPRDIGHLSMDTVLKVVCKKDQLGHYSNPAYMNLGDG